MIVEVKNLVKRYSELTALDHFNLNIKEGEILGLLGPNGSGKTTFINCLLSLLKYDKGEIKIFGSAMSPTNYSVKANIGLVPQELILLEDLSVKENIDFFCSLYVSDYKKRKQLVEEAMEFVELKKYENFSQKKLSGGLKRRLNIACGIAHKPKLLILDEPTVAVDAQSRNFILSGLKKLSRTGTTIIYTTHYIEEADELCSRIAIIDKGKNIIDGSPHELKSNISISEKIFISIVNDNDKVQEILKTLPHLTGIEKNESEYVLYFKKSTTNITDLVNKLNENSYYYSKIFSEEPTLNDVFLELTGKELRDR